MDDPAGRDRLAIYERDACGERVADGDWLVTDAQRAAAGRETVAARFRALLPANRERAAAQYAGGGVPDDEEAVRVWFPRDPAELAARLSAGRPIDAWADGDVLHVLWRGHAAQVRLAGGLSLPLWPVDGADGLWEASVRVRRLREAVITLSAQPLDEGDAPAGRRIGDSLTFRGDHAPVREMNAGLEGVIEEHVLESAALGAGRGVTVYLPPDTRGRVLPGCLLADGQAVTGFAPVLEAAVRAGTAPAAVLVGVHNAAVTGPARPPRADLRALEYLPSLRSRRFGAHLRFAADEVIPWAAGRFPVAARPWTAAGFSNGAVWAIAAGQRRPEVFGAVAALSAGVVPRQIAARSRGVRHFLAAGTLEPGFRRQTRDWARRLERAGLAVTYSEWAGGHDPWWWQTRLPAALAWLLSPDGEGGPRR